MQGVFSAEPAILVHFKPIRIVLLVFHCVVVALLTFCASKCDFNSHNGTSRFTEIFFAFTLTPNKRRRKSKRLPRFEENRRTAGKFARRKAHYGALIAQPVLTQKKRTF